MVLFYCFYECTFLEVLYLQIRSIMREEDKDIFMLESLDKQQVSEEVPVAFNLLLFPEK